jgi:large subunit ribosomal protein L9
MKVLFLQLVPNVWHVGDIKEISDSYARNFLIPKWLAKKLDPNEEKKLLQEQKKKEESRRNLIENRHKIIELLNGKTLVFKANTLQNGKMFWGIGEHDIIHRIALDFHIDLEKKHIDLMDGHIKKIGKKDIYIKLSSDSIAKITIIVE